MLRRTFVGMAASAANGADGWISLFDGKSFAGWVDPARKSPPGDSWTIEDGCLKARHKPRIREDLVSEQTFRDFELEFEWRLNSGGNSGVKYRIQHLLFVQSSKSKPGAKGSEEVYDHEIKNRLSDRSKITPSETGVQYSVAFEYQIVDNAKNRDAARGPLYMAGALYSMIPASRDAAKPAGQFNQSRIVVRGMDSEHWLNGAQVMSGRLDSPAVEEATRKRHGKEAAIYRMLTRLEKKDCPIALQHHVDEAWYRAIRIRRL